MTRALFVLAGVITLASLADDWLRAAQDRMLSPFAWFLIAVIAWAAWYATWRRAKR